MLIKISKAAIKLGVSRQTLENWGKAGILNIVKRGNAHWVYSETIEQMKDTPNVIEETLLKIQSLKESYQRKEQELENIIEQLQSDIMFYRRVGVFICAKEFYLSIPDMLYSIGRIDFRQKKIIQSFIEGKNIDDICLQHNLSRQRVYQVFYKAIRMSSELSGFAEKVKNADDSQKELEYLRKRVYDLEMKSGDNISRNYKILSKKIVDLHLGIRLTNVLTAAGISNVYELLQYNREDLLLFRNMGRKSLRELEEIIQEIKEKLI